MSASAVDGDGGGQGGEGGVAVSKHAAKQKARHAKRLARHAQKMRTQEEMKLRQREEERMEAVEYCRANLQQDCGRTDDPLAPPPNPERALLLLQYSGTNYKGVQIQNRSRIATIEGDLLHGKEADECGPAAQSCLRVRAASSLSSLLSLLCSRSQLSTAPAASALILL